MTPWGAAQFDFMTLALIYVQKWPSQKRCVFHIKIRIIFMSFSSKCVFNGLDGTKMSSTLLRFNFLSTIIMHNPLLSSCLVKTKLFTKPRPSHSNSNFTLHAFTSFHFILQPQSQSHF